MSDFPVDYMSTPAGRAFLDALYQHADQPVHLEIDVLQWVVITGALQLALRYPEYPATSWHILERLLQCWMTHAHTLDPRLAAGMALGMPAAHTEPLDQHRRLFPEFYGALRSVEVANDREAPDVPRCDQYRMVCSCCGQVVHWCGCDAYHLTRTVDACATCRTAERGG